MAAIRIIPNRRNAPRFPILKCHRIRSVRTEERKSFLEVGEPKAVGRYRVEQIPHRRIICAVANQYEMIKTCRIVDEVGDDTASKVKLSKILIGQHKF